MKERWVANFGAGQRQIEGCRSQRGERGPFLDRMPIGEGTQKREQCPYDKENNAGYYRHVIPGDGEHMGEARNIHGLIHLRRDGAAFASDER